MTTRGKTWMVQERQRIAKRWLIFILKIFERIDNVLAKNG